MYTIYNMESSNTNMSPLGDDPEHLGLACRRTYYSASVTLRISNVFPSRWVLGTSGEG